MTHIGNEYVREKVVIIPAKVERIQYYRMNYMCKPCEEDEVSSFFKTQPPSPLIPNSMASPSTVAHIMYQKYVNGTPLYHQEKDWELFDVFFKRSTMANWVNACTLTYFKPIYQALKLIYVEESLSWPMRPHAKS